MNLSVITAVLDSEKTIASCIDSIINQDLDNIEHCVIDGVSNDATLDIIKSYSSPIKILSEPDKGIYDALNKGIEMTTGDVIGFLHADDFYPNIHVLEKVQQLFVDKPIDACYGDLIYVDSQDVNKVKRFWRSGSYDPRQFYWGWMPPHPTFFVRRSIYEKYGLFNLEMGTAADYEIMLRFLLKRQINVAYIPEVLVHMRCGGVSNLSLGNRLKANRMDRKAWEVNGLKPYPWTLWAKPLRKLGQWIVMK